MIGKRLCKGDTIALISPASPAKDEEIEQAIDFFNSLGFKIKEGAHLHDKWGYLAGKDEDRAKDFMNAFLDDEADIIMCMRGGYGTMRILPLIDFNVIRNNPKVFIGFSDITPLLNHMAQKYGLITFHGPMGSSNFNDAATFNSFRNTLEMGTNPYTLSNPDNIKADCLIPGEAAGKLLGGNLGLICDTIGSEFEVDTTDCILFIEEVGEEPYRIDRMLTQLLLSGKLQCCKGFILGQFKNCTLPHYERSLTLEQIIEDRILPLGKPTIANFMSGHSYPKLTLPIGAQVTLNAEAGELKIMEAVVK